MSDEKKSCDEFIMDQLHWSQDMARKHMALAVNVYANLVANRAKDLAAEIIQAQELRTCSDDWIKEHFEEMEGESACAIERFRHTQTTESIERMNNQVQHLMSDVIALLETIRSEAEGGERHEEDPHTL